MAFLAHFGWHSTQIIADGAIWATYLDSGREMPSETACRPL